MKLKALIVASLLTVSVGVLLAQGQLSGDAVCGAGDKACTFADLKKVLSGAILFILQLAIAFMVVMIMYSAAKVMIAQDKAGALKEAKTRLWNVVFGLLLITVVAGGGYVAFLTYLNVDGQFLNTVKQIFSIHLSDVVPFAQASAQDTSGTLPNPLGTTTSLFDFLAMLLSLVIRWFVFPVIIFSWLYTGFQYVYAQGNPQKLMEAHKWLWWTLIGTVTIMLAEGFTLALQGTFKQFFS